MQKSNDAQANASSAAVQAPVTKTVRRTQPAGLNVDQVGQSLSSKSASKIRTALTGKTVTLELIKTDAKTYDVKDLEAAVVACRAADAGFEGGEVTAKVRSYKAATKSAPAVLDLDNCASNFVTVTESAPAPAAAASSATAKAAAPAASTGAKPGMDAAGNVVDSSKVESGSGRTVKGINDYEGEITGIPAKNSKFTNLKIGMSFKQATDIAGEPTDSGAYVTGKAFIPFYFGGDRARSELTYKGQGRLIFAGGAGFGGATGGNLIWIIHNQNESGYR